MYKLDVVAEILGNFMQRLKAHITPALCTFSLQGHGEWVLLLYIILQIPFYKLSYAFEMLTIIFAQLLFLIF